MHLGVRISVLKCIVIELGLNTQVSLLSSELLEVESRIEEC